ncbi:hypothetical protein N0V94_006458 [Neodidymelliopsis sp. IMI 364377]|nr:hypothetical protein N0V94_006458 [Neodidymelliopsis sp. IMI 364377]
MSPQNNDLAALKKLLRSKDLERQNLKKLEYFTKSTDALPDAPDCQFREDLGVAPPGELGIALLYGQDLVDFVNDPNSSLENLFASIRAYHIRIIERCHMINRLDGCTDNTEENFLSGTTGFLYEEEAKEMVKSLFTESTYQTADERRPLILTGQGFHQDLRILKKRWGIDVHKLDIVDMMQAKYVALDAGIVREEDEKGLKALIEGFGLGSAESWFLHNAGNDAVLTLVVTLLSGLNQTLHLFAAPGIGYPPHTVEGRGVRDILRSATLRIKSASKSDWEIASFCDRCEEEGHMARDCGAEISPCEECGSDRHQVFRCLKSVTKVEEVEEEQSDVQMEDV